MTSVIDAKALNELLDSGAPLTLLDVRRSSDYEADPNIIKGAVWRDPEKIGDWGGQIPKDHRTVVYCVKGGAVSRSVTDRLRGEGLNAVFLDGGLRGWIESGRPTNAAHYSEQGRNGGERDDRNTGHRY